MKRRKHERGPRREAGSFPSFLYKSLDDLEGAWGEPDDDSSLIREAHALHRKPLLLLTDPELDLALRQRIGSPWVLALALVRLRQDPLREGFVGLPGDLLRNALDHTSRSSDDLVQQLEEIADAIVPTLETNEDHEPLIAAYRRFKQII